MGVEEVNANNEILNEFQLYSVILKSSQDKYERLFKLRRDITIESKRVIFLLHSIDKNSDRSVKLEEAKQRLKEVKSNFYQKISQELEGVDPYKYLRAISPGNQEYIEAATFLNYLETGAPMGPEICKDLPFAPVLDYVLGIADLTGELMRHCISSIGMGNNANPNDIRSVIRELYSSMLILPHSKELEEKFRVIRANTLKVERVCYNLHIMGNEVPKDMQFFLNKPQRTENDDLML